MIKEALQWIQEKTTPLQVNVGGREYTTQRLTPVLDPFPDPLAVHTLTGIKDYIAALKDSDGLSDKAPFLQVLSHDCVKLHTAIEGKFEQRATYLVAEPPENGRFRFGQWMEVEPFIIALQALFVPDENTAALQAFISAIREASDRVSADDGISQTVTAKTGVALVTETKVPNPVTLRPYRTFMEVEQPEISCVFRLQKGPLLSLHEADGGLWRLQAIQSIKEYLVKAMADLGQDIPVIA